MIKRQPFVVNAEQVEDRGMEIRPRHELVGGFPAEREAHRHAWWTNRHPNEVDRIARLKAALGDLDRAQATLLSFINGLTDGG